MTTTPPPSLPFKVGDELRLLTDNAPFKAGARVRVERVDSLLSTGNHAPLTAATVTYKISGHAGRITTKVFDTTRVVRKVGHNLLSLTPNGAPSTDGYEPDQEVYLLKDVHWVIGKSSGTLNRGARVAVQGGALTHNGTQTTKATSSFYTVVPVVLTQEDKWSPTERRALHSELSRR